MAGKEAVVEVDDEGAVTVDISDMPELQEVEPAQEQLAKTPAPAAAPPPAKATPPAETALNEAIRKAEEGRQAAERQAAEERRQREAAQREAAQRADEARRAREEAQGHELTIVSNGIEAAKSRQATAKAAFERFMEQGEYTKASDAQVELAEATAVLVELAREKTRIESAPRPAVTEGAVTPGFETWMSQNMTPRSAAWLRAHPEFAPPQFGGDARKNAAMVSAHWDAQARGIQLESPEYFDLIEEKVGLKQPPPAAAASGPVSAAAVVEPADPAPAAKPRRPAPVAAPVSREAPAAAGARATRSVTLSPDQREAAKMSFPHLAEKEAYSLYARNLLQLEAEGKMGRLTH